MNKRLMLGTVALATVGLMSAFATTAYATPSKKTSCAGCHDGVALAVTATQTSNNGTTANYTVSAPGAYYIAVFDGATKIAQITGASGSVAVADGKTYVLQAVEGPTTSDGWGSTSISPVAPAPVPVPVPVPDPTPVPVPVPDPTPVPVPVPDPTPVPVPDPTPIPVPVPDPTPIPVPDPTPVPVPTPDPTPVPVPTPVPTPVPVPGATTAALQVRVLNSHGDALRKASVVVTNLVTGETFTAKTDSRGRVTFKGLELGDYKVTVTSGKYSGKAIVELEHNDSLKLKLKKTSSKSGNHKD